MHCIVSELDMSKNMNNEISSLVSKLFYVYFLIVVSSVT